MKQNQDYKNAALAALKGNWPSAVLAMLVYLFISVIAVSPNVVSQVQLALNPSASGFFATHSGATSGFIYLMELLVLYSQQASCQWGCRPCPWHVQFCPDKVLAYRPCLIAATCLHLPLEPSAHCSGHHQGVLIFNDLVHSGRRA